MIEPVQPAPDGPRSIAALDQGRFDRQRGAAIAHADDEGGLVFRSRALHRNQEDYKEHDQREECEQGTQVTTKEDRKENQNEQHNDHWPLSGVVEKSNIKLGAICPRLNGRKLVLERRIESHQPFFGTVADHVVSRHTELPRVLTLGTCLVQTPKPAVMLSEGAALP